MKLDFGGAQTIFPNVCRTCMNVSKLQDILEPNIIMKLKECTNLQVSIALYVLINDLIHNLN